MTLICNNNALECVDISENKSSPTPYRIDLKTIDDVRVELARVYRDMKSQRIATADGTRLAYVLYQIGKLIEIHDIEKRLDILENSYGNKR